MLTKGEVRALVIARDRQCIAAALDLSHQCRNMYGQPHSPFRELTLEHVKDGGGGMRIDDPAHCMALCWHANVMEHWSSPTENNRLARAYLLGIAVGERSSSDRAGDG